MTAFLFNRIDLEVALTILKKYLEMEKRGRAAERKT